MGIVKCLETRAKRIIFQIENLDFGAIKPALERVKKSITTLKSLSLIGKADWQKELTEWEHQYVDGSLSGHNEASLLAIFVQPFITAVQTNLLERFPDQDIDILSAGEVFNPSKVPSTSIECYSYGREKLLKLAQHFGCDEEHTIKEWKEVVQTIQKMTNVQEVLKFIISHRSLYAYLGKIACALSVVPMHSADCERGFSA